MIRKLALATFITTVLSTLLGLDSALSGLARLGEGTNSLAPVFLFPVMLVAGLFGCIMPVFLFALYRNRGTLRFTKTLRRISLAAALGMTVNLAAQLSQWLASLSRPQIATELFAAVSALLSEGVFILLLVEFFRSLPVPAKADDTASSFLKRSARVAVIVWRVFVLILLARLALTHFIWLSLANAAAAIGRTPPSEGAMWTDALQRFVANACILAAPWVVYKSTRPAPVQPVEITV